MTVLVDGPGVVKVGERPRVEDAGAVRTVALGERRVVALDGVRGVAVVSVILFHWLGILGHTNPLIHGVLVASRVGWVGVELFFALSGFLITGILADAKEGVVSAGRYFGTFYGRRCLRIFPLYYGVIAAILVAGFVVPGLGTEGHRQFVHDQGWLWLYGVNVGIGTAGQARFEYDWFDLTHFWTLAVEEHFYLVWPLVMWGLSRRRAMGVAVGIFIGALALRVWGPPMGSGWVRGVMATPMSAGGLAAGAWVALWLRSGVAEEKARRMLGWGAVVGLIGVVAVGVGAGGFLVGQRLVQTAGISMLGVLFAGVVGYMAVGGNWVMRKVLESGGLVTLGKYSYGLYVFHHVLSATFRKWNYPHWFGSYTVGALAYLGLATVITVGLAWTSWHLYERQFLKLKKWLPYR